MIPATPDGFIRRATITRRCARLMLAVGTALAIAVGVLVFGMIRFGAWSAGFEWLAGRQIIIVPSRLVLGVDPREGSNHVQERDFQIFNCTGRPLSLLGAAAGCPCAAVTLNTNQVPHGAFGTFHAVIRDNKAARVGRTRITIWTDCDEQPSVTAALSFKAANVRGEP